MLYHIALLRFKKDFSESDKRIASVKLKKGLENLAGKINGLVSIRVENILLSTSNVDMLVYAQFENKEALDRYHTSPLTYDFKFTLDSSMETTYTADFIS